MGEWDELCLICGISPNPPACICVNASYGARDLADKITGYDPSLLDDMEMDRDALQNLLRTALEAEHADGLDRRARAGWEWEEFQKCIAVGHFGNDGNTPHEIIRTDAEYVRKIPDGKDVETRLVDNATWGQFWVVIHRTVDEQGNVVVESQEETFTNTSSSSYMYDDLLEGCEIFGNFFLSEGCFHYLQAWLDFSRFPKPQHDPQLTFEGELYEVVNSRKVGRASEIGILPYINYDGIESTLEQFQDESYNNLKIPKHTAASVRNNDSLEKILDSIARDCRAWMFCDPDMWPVADNDFMVKYAFSRFSLGTSPSDMLACLPNEILFNIVQFSNSLLTYLALASTSKWLYNTLANPSFLNPTLSIMAGSPSGCLFWVRPVASVHGEQKKAYDAVSTFLPHIEINSNSGTVKKEADALIPFDHHDFPWYYFVRRCFESDSMRNRKRIWGQVKQFEEIWKDYRENGWEVDRFGVPLE